MDNLYEPQKIESEILEFWRKNKIFEKSVSQRKGKRHFIFYEGPPSANGLPGIHHLIARAYKDIVLRYKTMAGFYAPRRAGWDTHGLPIEIETERKLGVKNKKEIEEKIGIEKFVTEAKKNVFIYKKEWEKFTEKQGFWLDMENAYATMDNEYIETLWWIMAELYRKKLLYEDYKIMPWCPRCGTGLSSHELALGYEKVKEESVYVKFRIKNPPKNQSAYFLVWTTTPWTLPANVALGIKPDADYITAEKNGEWLILAKERLEILESGYKIISQEKGDSLVGVEYEALYPRKDAAYHKVVAANFVNTKEGTGVVHLAPAFGQDDLEAGKKYHLPAPITVDEEGKMIGEGKKWDGIFVKDADPLIREDLSSRGLLYKTENYEHDYPFCWRCHSPLIYYLKNSWWMNTTAVKNKMIKSNAKIGWHPEHLRDGRFGGWLKENIDWGFSRERYWGTPLPIWRCEKCKSDIAIGSYEDLDRLAFSPKTFYLMRHGEADSNVKHLVGPVWKEYDENNHLTPKGKKQILASAKKLLKEKIDLIIVSPLQRTRETAAIVSEILKVPVVIHKDLYDIDEGVLHGKTMKEANRMFPFGVRLENAPEKGESIRDARIRMMAAVKDILFKNQGKKILIITHGDPSWILMAALEGVKKKNYQKSYYLKTGEVKKILFHNWPYNKEGELDFHRPYVDEIKLKCERCGGEARRLKYVVDVWFDSGAMPFAQDHWPFAQNQKFINPPKNYPADYICEGVDQTRGWFYTLLAVAALLGFESPYKNVISTGLVLDKKGQKMSKSKGNVVDPSTLFEKYGADAVRWYFFTINQPWDDKLFNEEDVKKVIGRFLNILWNSFVYWKTYKTLHPTPHTLDPKLILNKWLIARFNQLVFGITKLLDDYDIVAAARKIENFMVEDISHWYIRRVRNIMKIEKSKEAKETSQTLGFVLSELSKILAPLVPFFADYLFQEISGKKSSVHLEDWPKVSEKRKAKSEKLLKEMAEVRRIVSLALEARAKAGIRIRQPLRKLEIKNYELRNKKEMLELIKGETNIKEIGFDKKIKNEIELDVKITPELKEEGMMRELVRQIQDLRKKRNLKPKDLAELYIFTDIKGRNWLIKNAKIIKKETNLKSIILSKNPLPKDSFVFELDNMKFEMNLRV